MDQAITAGVLLLVVAGALFVALRRLPQPSPPYDPAASMLAMQRAFQRVTQAVDEQFVPALQRTGQALMRFGDAWAAHNDTVADPSTGR